MKGKLTYDNEKKECVFNENLTGFGYYYEITTNVDENNNPSFDYKVFWKKEDCQDTLLEAIAPTKEIAMGSISSWFAAYLNVAEQPA